MNCPLCNHDVAKPSWIGSTFYLGSEFPYVQCASCGSLYCDSVPGDDVLARMYGSEYQTSFGHDPSVEDPKQPQRVIEWLRKLGSGTFIDYGCGAGSLLKEAMRLDWQAFGVEFDAEVARNAEEYSGAKVVVRPEELFEGPRADVLHLGDVIEHLTSLDRQFRTVVEMIKPGGLLLAQGPLEANANLFTFALRSAPRLDRRRRTEMPPYHLLLATAQGQRCLFRRVGLEEIEFSMHEVAWPAPARLSLRDLRRPWPTALFMLRRVSQAVSVLAPNRWGNRYFFVGRRVGCASTQWHRRLAGGGKLVPTASLMSHRRDAGAT
jgi:SAM-dependent methyltransferase